MKVKYTKKIEYHVDKFGAMEVNFKNAAKITIELGDEDCKAMPERDEHFVREVANLCKVFLQ